jgi:transposase-like protein
MTERRKKFTASFKEEAVMMVIESSRPIADVAREIHINEGTLGNWVNRYRKEHAGEEPPTRGRCLPTLARPGIRRRRAPHRSVADAFGIREAIRAIATLTAASGLVVALRRYETHQPLTQVKPS